MKVLSNEPLIRRRSRRAQIANLAGLLVLGAGLVISLIKPEWAIYTLGLLVIGVIASQYGIVQAFRYARKPRPDEELASALKGLDDRFRLYNFVMPADHVLLTPRGLYTVVLKSVDGKVVCEGKTCKQERKFSLGRLLRLFSPESLGNPLREAQWEAEALTKWLAEKAPEATTGVEGAVVFLSPKVDLEARNPDALTVRAKALKDALRKTEKPALGAEEHRRLVRLFDETAAAQAK